MPIVQDLAAVLDRYRGHSDGCEAIIEKVEDALRAAVEKQTPFKYVTVQFLMPADADADGLLDILSNLRDTHFNNPIAEWRMVTADPVPLSGPQAEDMFDQHDLVYPGKEAYDKAVVR